VADSTVDRHSPSSPSVRIVVARIRVAWGVVGMYRWRSSVSSLLVAV
jgi:hypothetical protein